MEESGSRHPSVMLFACTNAPHPLNRQKEPYAHTLPFCPVCPPHVSCFMLGIAYRRSARSYRLRCRVIKRICARRQLQTCRGRQAHRRERPRHPAVRVRGRLGQRPGLYCGAHGYDCPGDGARAQLPARPEVRQHHPDGQASREDRRLGMQHHHQRRAQERGRLHRPLHGFQPGRRRR